MPLKLLIAGCSKDERERIEPLARGVFGARTQAESWVASIVKVGGRWSVTLDGPGAQRATFMSAEENLKDSLRNAIGGGIAGPVESPVSTPVSPSSSSSRRAGEQRDRHDCEHCHQPFLVVYESLAGEPQEPAAVACPHCWKINRVPVAKEARAAQDYTAERLES